jgi:hypothetical protein
MRGHAPERFAVALVAIAMASGARIAKAQAPDQSRAEDVVDMTEGAPKEPEESIVKDPVVAKKWITAGQMLMQMGDQAARQGNAAEAKTNYENAVTAYRNAMRASDDRALVLPLALAYEKAGDLPRALLTARTLVVAGLEPGAGLKPEVVKKAQAKIDELSTKVGIVKLTIVPERTQVSIGDNRYGSSPLSEPLVLMPGTHVVTLAAVGYHPRNIELKIEAGLESERKIQLERVPTDTKQPVVPLAPERPGTPDPGPSKVPLYLGGGAAIGLVMVAAVTGIAAVSVHGRYEVSIDPGERLDLSSRGKTFAFVADLSLVGAVGAAAFTTYWYVKKYKPAKDVPPERSAGVVPKVDVVPWVQSDAGGLTAVGMF